MNTVGVCGWLGPALLAAASLPALLQQRAAGPAGPVAQPCVAPAFRSAGCTLAANPTPDRPTTCVTHERRGPCICLAASGLQHCRVQQGCRMQLSGSSGRPLHSSRSSSTKPHALQHHARIQSRLSSVRVCAQQQPGQQGGRVDKGLSVLEWTGKLVPQGQLVYGEWRHDGKSCMLQQGSIPCCCWAPTGGPRHGDAHCKALMRAMDTHAQRRCEDGVAACMAGHGEGASPTGQVGRIPTPGLCLCQQDRGDPWFPCGERQVSICIEAHPGVEWSAVGSQGRAGDLPQPKRSAFLWPCLACISQEGPAPAGLNLRSCSSVSQLLCPRPRVIRAGTICTWATPAPGATGCCWSLCCAACCAQPPAHRAPVQAVPAAGQQHQGRQGQGATSASPAWGRTPRARGGAVGCLRPLTQIPYGALLTCGEAGMGSGSRAPG